MGDWILGVGACLMVLCVLLPIGAQMWMDALERWYWHRCTIRERKDKR